MYRDEIGKNRRWFPTDDIPRKRKSVFVSITTPVKKNGMKAFVQALSFQAMRKAGVFKPIGKNIPLIVDAVFVFGPNKSDTQKLHALKVEMLHPHTIRPDVDNIGKGLLDGMTNSVYHDDTQIIACNLYKTYGPVAGLRCRVYAADMEQFPAALNDMFPEGICPK